MVTMELEDGQPVETLHYIHRKPAPETIVRLRLEGCLLRRHGLLRPGATGW